MQVAMTSRAKRNEILLLVSTSSAAKVQMMHFQSRATAAELASPPVSDQHRASQLGIMLGIEPHAGPFRQ